MTQELLICSFYYAEVVHIARPMRLEFAGAIYHVTSRGDRREDIYVSDVGREHFIKILGDVCQRYNWVCHAYCLMSNHYHLLIETPDANLSKGMRQLNGVYSQAYNRANDRVEHVFQDRYKTIMVEKQAYLLELARYVVLNPVRARMVRSVNQWRWSCNRATTGQALKPEWLNTDWLLSSFSKRKGQAVTLYKAFVAEGQGQASPWLQLRSQVYLGDDEFMAQMNAMIDADKELAEIPSSQRWPMPKVLSVYEKNARSRKGAIVAAYLSGDYSLKEVGDYFGLHYSTVSGIVRAINQ